MEKAIIKDIQNQLNNFNKAIKLAGSELCVNADQLHIMAPGQPNKPVEKNRLFIYGFLAANADGKTYEWLTIEKGGVKGALSFADNFKSSSSATNLAKSLEKEKRNPLYMPAKGDDTGKWMIENLYRFHFYLPEGADTITQNFLESFLQLANKTRFEN